MGGEEANEVVGANEEFVGPLCIVLDRPRNRAEHFQRVQPESLVRGRVRIDELDGAARLLAGQIQDEIKLCLALGQGGAEGDVAGADGNPTEYAFQEVGVERDIGDAGSDSNLR